MKYLNIRRLFILFVPFVVLAYVSVNEYYKLITANELNLIKNGVLNQLEEKSYTVQEIYTQLESDIELLRWQYQNTFQESRSTDIKVREQFFVHFANSQKTLDQVRYLDTLGRELIRVDYNTGYQATLQQTEKLQDKSNRYYFKSIKQLENDEIYFSNIDLNVENGEIESPHNPVLRVAVKTFDRNNNWNGIIIINYFTGDFLEFLSAENTELFSSIEIINPDGFYLSSTNKTHNFSHILLPADSVVSLEQKQPQLWEMIRNNDEGSYMGKEHLYTFKKTTFSTHSGRDVVFENAGQLILLNSIDLNKVNASQSIYRLYKWVFFAVLVLVILMVLLVVQIYNHRLKYQNNKLEQANNELESIKEKLEHTLQIKLDELSLTERKFYSLFNNAGIGITLVGTDSKPIFVNKRLVDILGYSQEELSELTFAEFTHPDDVEKDVEQFRRLLNREIDSYTMEKRYIRKDGSVIWGNLNVSLLMDTDNHIHSVIGAVSDITEKKINELRLFESAQIINQMVEAILSTDVNGKITHWNNGAQKLFGYTANEILNQPVTVLYHPDTGKDDVFNAFELLKTRASVSFEAQMVKKNGERFIAEINISRKYDEEGRVVGNIVSVVNISERKNAERQLLRLNKELDEKVRFLNNTMEFSPIAMWIANPQGTIIKTNKALREILNLRDDQILGVYNVFEDQNLIDQKVMPRVKRIFTEHVQDRFEIWWQEDNMGLETFKRPIKYWMDITMFPIVDREGVLQNVMCQWLDISDRKKVEKEIQNYQFEL